MNHKEMLYEGKAKKVYAMEDSDLVMVEYKDDATAFNGLKKGTIEGKGVVNNLMSNYMFQYLEKKGVPTHFVEQIDDRHTIVKKVQIVPLEVIVRNRAAGSFCKRYGAKEGLVFAKPTFEFSYKNDDLGDPLLNEDHALALNLATKEEIDQIRHMALTVNKEMGELLLSVGIVLVDFKLEFGRLPDGKIVLADEISPDTCRFWDAKTGEKLDKDRFRLDLGDEQQGYRELFKRLGLEK